MRTRNQGRPLLTSSHQPVALTANIEVEMGQTYDLVVLAGWDGEGLQECRMLVDHCKKRTLVFSLACGMGGNVNIPNHSCRVPQLTAIFMRSHPFVPPYAEHIKVVSSLWWASVRWRQTTSSAVSCPKSGSARRSISRSSPASHLDSSQTSAVPRGPKYCSQSSASVGGKECHAMSANTVWLSIEAEESESAYGQPLLPLPLLPLLLLVVVVAVMDLGRQRCAESEGRMRRQSC
jgi:hypothetical protein